MWKDGNDYRFSPSDLIRFFESSYITWMDRYLLDCPSDVQADQDSDEIELIRQKGWEHEREFLAELRHAGKEVTDLGEGEGRSRRTVDAMQRGADVIYQGCLELDPFQGYPDFLVRVDYPSALGTWSYEVWDTKLARHPKPYFLIQLCAYAEMLEAVQGVGPREVRVVLGRKDPDAKIVPFRTEEFLYYFGVLKQAFLEQQRHFDRSECPEIPVSKDLGRWAGHASRQLVALDDLSLVADIRRSQIRKLRSAGISTVAALGACDGVEIPKLAPAVFSRLRQQARLQIESRGRPRPNFLVLPQEQDIQKLGVRALPPPSEGDVFFDIEGFPLVDDGREYLFGTCYWHDGSLKFRDWWAHSVSEERAAFADFVRWLCERRKQYPGLHVYHYASYEVTALRRLMGRHGICESEVDGLLRGEVFVDLYRIVRQSLLIGQPSYSLKDVEQLYRPKRGGEVANAGASMVMYQRWIMEPEGGSPATSSLLESIRAYNEDDCRSTAELAHWLRTLPAADDSASKVGENAEEIEEEEFAASEDLQRRAGLARSLLDEVPADWETRDDRERWRIQQLLAHLLEFHRREQKPSWWKRFDRQKMDEGELFNDAECLAGLERTEKRATSIKQSSGYQFRFNPHQETKVREGDQCLFAHDWRLKATVISLDFDNGLIELKISNRQGPPPRRLSLAPEDLLVGKHLDAAVERLVTKWRSSDRLPPALEDFLYRRRPRLRGYSGGPILKDGIDSVQGAVDAAMALDNSTLSIQGPPGTGKTYTAARMAAACLAQGYRVGVTSQSHLAINLLLGEALKAAANQGAVVDAVKVGGDEDAAGLPEGMKLVSSGKKLFGESALPSLIGGTAWAFAVAEAEQRIDYLFVDEAGQISIAKLVAMSAASRNIILVGDQMQLPQPIQGSHPGESGLSTLEYLLQGHATVPADFGIFIKRTRRLHPALCRFISNAIYDRFLEAAEETSERALVAPEGFPAWLTRSAGLVYVPVEHEDNAYESPEEEDLIAGLIEDLERLQFREIGGHTRQLTRADIRVVAPYNLQVRRLARRLRGVAVGTVDKFQGQEAAIVILSMCSSSGDKSPRGMEFLFNKNRLNVALSRAQVLSVVVGNPQLTRSNCTTVDQMRLVNLYCRLVDEVGVLEKATG